MNGEIPASTVNSLLVTVATISVAVNSWFLRGVARKIEAIDSRQRRHADRLTWLEAHHAAMPLRRRHDHDTSGDYLLPPDEPEG